MVTAAVAADICHATLIAGLVSEGEGEATPGICARTLELSVELESPRMLPLGCCSGNRYPENADRDALLAQSDRVEARQDEAASSTITAPRAP